MVGASIAMTLIRPPCRESIQGEEAMKLQHILIASVAGLALVGGSVLGIGAVREHDRDETVTPVTVTATTEDAPIHTELGVEKDSRHGWGRGGWGRGGGYRGYRGGWYGRGYGWRGGRWGYWGPAYGCTWYGYCW